MYLIHQRKGILKIQYIDMFNTLNKSMKNLPSEKELPKLGSLSEMSTNMIKLLHISYLSATLPIEHRKSLPEATCPPTLPGV